MVKVKERCNLGDLGVDGSLLLKCLSKKEGGRTWAAFIWLRRGASGFQ
jgi:hypothetical protein